MKPYQTLASRLLFQSRWYQLRQDDVILPNGEQTVYNVIQKGDAVWVVPVLTDGRIVLINQYRYAIDQWCLELPAGNIGSDTTPEETAHRELLEEVGGRTASMTFLGKYWTMKGIGNEMGHFYLARDVTLSGKFDHEPTEVIELQIVPARQAIEMARSGQIPDAPSALALLLCEKYLFA